MLTGALLAATLVGPPEPPDWRRVRPEAQTQQQVEAQARPAWLLLVAGQAWDLAETEKGLKWDGRQPAKGWSHFQAHEANPLPGMQSTAGRVAWGLVELGAVWVLERVWPEGARWWAKVSAGAHGWMATRWAAKTESYERFERKAQGVERAGRVRW